jgi:hypothetical protein
MVLAFVVGAAATLIGSDLRFPQGLYRGLSMLLLLSIGLRGGVHLAEADLLRVLPPALGTIALGVALPILVFVIARGIGRLSIDDAAAMAAHYGSVSAVTFVAATAFVQSTGAQPEGFLSGLVALLEVPAIIVALVLARRAGAGGGDFGRAVKEAVLGRSVMLLVGGLVIGAAAGEHGYRDVAPLFDAPFKGALTLFMLELGAIAAGQIATVGKHLGFVLVFGTLVPIMNGAIALVVARLVGLSPSGATVFAAMAASASYIAAPAAVGTALPRANAGLYLTSSLGVTFPFNLALGIPLYHLLASAIVG